MKRMLVCMRLPLSTALIWLEAGMTSVPGTTNGFFPATADMGSLGQAPSEDSCWGRGRERGNEESGDCAGLERRGNYLAEAAAGQAEVRRQRNLHAKISFVGWGFNGRRSGSTAHLDRP